jgi:hypothetical protein
VRRAARCCEVFRGVARCEVMRGDERWSEVLRGVCEVSGDVAK